MSKQRILYQLRTRDGLKSEIREADGKLVFCPNSEEQSK